MVIVKKYTLVFVNFKTPFDSVWHWGFLCIKSIDDESIFKHTVLRPDDHIVSINGIECDRVGPAQFKLALDTLTKEITIVAKRRKQRFTGKFG